MKFSLYDLVSQLIIGYFLLIVILAISPNSEGSLPGGELALLPIAYIIGYFINTISSWGEDILFWTWGGKPSTNLLMGRSRTRIAFSAYKTVQQWIADDMELSTKERFFKDKKFISQLFSHTLHFASESSGRINELNASYAFSRNLIFTLLFSWILFFIEDWAGASSIGNYYHFIILFFIIAWIRGRERAYYVAREFLSNYYRVRLETKKRDLKSVPNSIDEGEEEP